MNHDKPQHQYLKAALDAAATRTYRMAARLGLSPAEREDLYQELILDLLERAPHYDPEKGSAGTFTGVVTEHRAVELQDRLIKDRMRLAFFSGAEAANDDCMHDGRDGPGEDVAPMWSDDRDLFADSMLLRDLETALAYMTDEQQALFALLDAHGDTASALQASGMASATFYRRVSDLRLHLRMFGIRAAA